MDDYNRRWQRGGNNYYYRNNQQKFSNRRSQNKKPPRGCWQPTVPSWEKSFCKVVGTLDWERFVDLKKYVHLYENVLKWNDSAGEEAFYNAKRRFLANMHGIPFDLPLPDPDLYMDKVDWDSKIDPRLISDLENNLVAADEGEKHDAVVIFGDSLLSNQAFSTNGWGEPDDAKQATGVAPLFNHSNPWECNKGNPEQNGWVDSGSNSWNLQEGAGSTVYSGWQWQGGLDNSWNWDPYKYSHNNAHPGYLNYGFAGEAWPTWDANHWNGGNDSSWWQ